MQIFDITVPLSGALPVFPGDPPVTIEMVTSRKRGDAVNVSRLSLCSHSGTHLDVPRHFSDQGSTTDDIPLALLVGEALVVEIPGVRLIGRALLETLPLQGVERLLFKTDNSGLWARAGFCAEYAALTEDGAEFLVQNGVRLVGIDYLSIEPFDGNGNVHRLLLDGGVLILEGVTLAAVAPGRYELICLPMKIQDGDGAPVRAILRRRGGAGASEHFNPHTTRWPLS